MLCCAYIDIATSIHDNNVIFALQLFGQTVEEITYVSLRNKDFKEVTLQASGQLIGSLILHGHLMMCELSLL